MGLCSSFKQPAELNEWPAFTLPRTLSCPCLAVIECESDQDDATTASLTFVTEIASLPDWFNASYVEGNLTWAIGQKAAVAIVLSLLGTAVMRNAFKRLIQRKEQAWFFGCTAVAILLLLSVVNTGFPRPRLVGEIYVTIYPSHADEKTFDIPTVFLIASITNIGSMPSVVSGWSLDVELNGSVFHGTPMTIPPQITITHSDGSPSQVYYAKQALYDRTAVPVGIGDRKTGILEYEFRDLQIQSLVNGSPKFTLHFSDALGQWRTVSFTANGSTSNQNFTIPGF